MDSPYTTTCVLTAIVGHAPAPDFTLDGSDIFATTLVTSDTMTQNLLDKFRPPLLDPWGL